MGKRKSPSTTTTATARLHQLTEIPAQLVKIPKRAKSISPHPVNSSETVRIVGGRESKWPKLKNKMEENNSSEKQNQRTPLSKVVSDCLKRWFLDTLKDAKAGDISMQVLVGQMYYTGYGVPRDAQKGRIWMTRASRVRSSVWKVSNKRPGYNASDSDSDELMGDS